MKMIEIDKVKFRYSYRIRNVIEKCSSKNFGKVLYNKKTYLIYGNSIYEAVFNKKNDSVHIQSKLKKDSSSIKDILDISDKEQFQAKEIIKNFSGLNIENMGFVNKHEIRIQNYTDKIYYNPKIEIINNKGIISDNEGTVIGNVNDIRSLSLIKSINKMQDITYLNAGELKIFTLKQIDNKERELKIYIDRDEKFFESIKNSIINGCEINNEVWLFVIPDRDTDTPDSHILLLPNNEKWKCYYNGQTLKLKKRINKNKIYFGISSLIRIKKDLVSFEQYDSSNNDDVDNYEFNILSNNNRNNIFIEYINNYKNIENEVLNQAIDECKDLRYKNLNKNTFIIANSHLEGLLNWDSKIGHPVVFKGKEKIQLGTIKEVGEDYVTIDFKDDMTKNSISKKSGVIGIDFTGSEVMQKRRDKAITLLENNAAALKDLDSILSGTKEFLDYKVKTVLEKFEKGNANEKQIAAINGILNSPDIFLVQGPPGTGKTTVIRKIVDKILENNEQVLVSSFQNLAVDNVLDGFKGNNIIPFRFGEEDNLTMSKICSEIAREINGSLKVNASKSQEKLLSDTRINLEELEGKLLNAEDKNSLVNIMKEILEVIFNYESENAYYTKINNILKKINRKDDEENIDFSKEKIINLLPESFDIDFEIMNSFEELEKYLKTVNRKLENKTVENIILKLKEIQDPDVFFDLNDREYQKIRNKILDDLKLIKEKVNEEEDYFSEKLEVTVVIDEYLERLPQYIEDDKYNKILDFHNKISNNYLYIREILEKYPDIIGTTCQKVGSFKFNEATKGINYDYVIIDEAARSNPLDLLIPLVKGKKVVLVGDHKQLPHMLESYVESKFNEDENYDPKLFDEYIRKSLFGRLYEELPSNRKIMLDTQYRMNKEIGDLVSRLFYNNKLKTMTNIKNDTPLYTGNSLISINVKGKEHRVNTGSIINQIEIDAIIDKLKELEKLNEDSDKKIEVGIISFYKAQVDRLKEKVRIAGFNNIDVSVGTVDSYQGLEKDIIFLSTVRTKGIGFTSNPNRLNVALSRAKKLIVLFGDLDNLKSNDMFNEIISSCKQGEV